LAHSVASKPDAFEHRVCADTGPLRRAFYRGIAGRSVSLGGFKSEVQNLSSMNQPESVTKVMSDFLNSVFWADTLPMIELSEIFDKTCSFRPLFNNDMI
jgi:hypothetical protein